MSRLQRLSFGAGVAALLALTGSRSVFPFPETAFLSSRDSAPLSPEPHQSGAEDGRKPRPSRRYVDRKPVRVKDLEKAGEPAPAPRVFGNAPEIPLPRPPDSSKGESPAPAYSQPFRIGSPPSDLSPPR